MPGHLALVVVLKRAEAALEEGMDPLQPPLHHMLCLHVEQDHLQAPVLVGSLLKKKIVLE